MGYETCMELAGAKIIAFQNFGSYQGDWLACVEYKNEILLINGSYGSCSGCDAFQGEFDCDSHEVKGEYHYYYELHDDCDECKKLKEKMIDFGKGYLDNPSNPEMLLEEYEKEKEWDGDKPEMIKFINEHFIEEKIKKMKDILEGE